MLPLLVIGVGVASYQNGLHTPFIFDDYRAIQDNARIRQLWPPWDALSPPPRSPLAGRPVANLSLAINYALTGLDVRGYHLGNLAIHILAALTLFGIVRRTLAGDPRCSGEAATWLGLATALIWVAHPLQSESVTYLTQRTESLMGLFFLLTLYCVIRGAASHHAGRWYAAAVLACGLGMGSKEVMVTAPVIVLVYDRIFLARSFRAALRQRWALYGGLAGCWFVLLLSAQGKLAYGTGLLSGSRRQSSVAVAAAITRWDYLRTQCGVILHYLRLCFWPDPLVTDYYDWPVAHSIAAIVPAAIVVVLLFGITLWALRRRPEVGFLGVWFFVILAPTSSLVPMTQELAAERRMYLPLAAVAALVVVGAYRAGAWGAGRLRPGRRLLTTVAVCLVASTVAALSYATQRRNEDYRSAVVLWRDVVAKRPHNGRAYLNLSNALTEAGETAEAQRQRAEAARLIAAQYCDWGNRLMAESNHDAAMANWREALRVDPNHAEAQQRLRAALAEMGSLP